MKTTQEHKLDNVLTLSPTNGLSYYLAIVIIFLVGQIRLLLYRSNKPWTNKIGGKWIWISVAAIISVAMCVILKINIIQDVTGLTSVGSVQLEGYIGYIASGIAISISSNISAWAAQRPYKVANTDLKEGNPVPGSPEALQTVVSDTPIKSKAISFTDLPAEPIKEEDFTDGLLSLTGYRTRLLTDFESGEVKPGYLLIEKESGVKKIIQLS